MEGLRGFVSSEPSYWGKWASSVHGEYIAKYNPINTQLHSASRIVFEMYPKINITRKTSPIKHSYNYLPPRWHNTGKGIQ